MAPPIKTAVADALVFTRTAWRLALHSKLFAHCSRLDFTHLLRRKKHAVRAASFESTSVPQHLFLQRVCSEGCRYAEMCDIPACFVPVSKSKARQCTPALPFVAAFRTSCCAPTTAVSDPKFRAQRDTSYKGSFMAHVSRLTGSGLCSCLASARSLFLFFCETSVKKALISCLPYSAACAATARAI